MVRLAVFVETKNVTHAITLAQLAPLSLGANQMPKITVCDTADLIKQIFIVMMMLCKIRCDLYTLVCEK